MRELTLWDEDCRCRYSQPGRARPAEQQKPKSTLPKNTSHTIFRKDISLRDAGRRGVDAKGLDCGKDADAASIARSGAPFLEVVKDFIFGDSFGSKHSLHPSCDLFKCIPFAFTSSAAGRNVVAHRVSVPGDCDWGIGFQQIVGKIVAKFPNSNLGCFHRWLFVLRTQVYHDVRKRCLGIGRHDRYIRGCGKTQRFEQE